MTNLDILRIAGTLRAKGHTLNEAALVAEWKAVDRAKGSAEDVMEDAVALVLETYAEKAANAVATITTEAKTLTARIKQDDADDLAFRTWLRGGKAAPGQPVTAEASFAINLAALWGALEGVIERNVLLAFRAGWATGLARVSFPLPFDAERQVVKDAIAKILNDAESIPFTFRSRVDTVIRDGLAAGKTGEELAAVVRAAAPDLTAKQAKTIARTAGTAGFEAGQVDGFTEAGIETKRWLSMRDDRVRDAHLALDGEEVPMGQAFSNGLDYPQEPNCRCTVLPVTVVKRVTWREERNARIRKAYPALRDDRGQVEALAELAQAENLSESYVRDLIYKG